MEAAFVAALGVIFIIICGVVYAIKGLLEVKNMERELKEQKSEGEKDEVQKPEDEEQAGE